MTTFLANLNSWLNIGAYYSAIAQGVVWGIMALGAYITFKILDYSDLTVDGSFATGAAICAALIVAGVNPFLSLLVAFAGGIIAGGITAFLHTKLKIPSLLSGILTQQALYSINLRIMGKANIGLLRIDTVYSMVSDTTNLSSVNAVLLVGGLLVALLILALYLFLKTEFGLALRATGSNQRMIRALGVNTNVMITFALMLGNGLVSLSGGMVAMQQGFADVGMGTGTMVIGLASVIIGEVVFGNKTIGQSLVATIMGSILYRIFVALALELGLPPTDLKLITAAIVALALALPIFKSNWLKNGVTRPHKNLQ